MSVSLSRQPKCDFYFKFESSLPRWRNNGEAVDILFLAWLIKNKICNARLLLPS